MFTLARSRIGIEINFSRCPSIVLVLRLHQQPISVGNMYALQNFELLEDRPRKSRYRDRHLRDVKQPHAGGRSGQDPSLRAPLLDSIRVQVLSVAWKCQI